MGFRRVPFQKMLQRAGRDQGAWKHVLPQHAAKAFPPYGKIKDMKKTFKPGWHSKIVHRIMVTGYRLRFSLQAFTQADPRLIPLQRLWHKLHTWPPHECRENISISQVSCSRIRACGIVSGLTVWGSLLVQNCQDTMCKFPNKGTHVQRTAEA